MTFLDVNLCWALLHLVKMSAAQVLRNTDRGDRATKTLKVQGILALWVYDAFASFCHGRSFSFSSWPQSKNVDS